MDKKIYNTLEYNKIIEMLKDQASSELGKDKCGELEPHLSIDAVNSAQAETADALTRLYRKSSISFFGNEEIVAAMKRLDKGSNISASELLMVARLLENVARVKSYGRRDNNDTGSDSLDAYFDALSPLSNLTARIRTCILSETEISDDASSTLKTIRRHQKATVDKIHSQLSQMVSTSHRTYLQDAVITMRDGRYCLPVKSEYKNNVPGMIHDQSSSASTFFIEPAAVVNLNNELRELELKEKAEIEVILAQLSAECAENTEIILNNLDLIATLDFIFANGKLALNMKASRPIYNTNRHVNLKKARHPLLDADSVVPINLEIGDSYDLLIITGPNTGGKTVALKTLGLFTLMGQAGLHIPALDSSELAIFDNVFADIGDEQSIEQSLSTFSSHMKRIVTIMDNADEDSLCLFDELGAGTDPTEGAALAIAILSRLHSMGIRTVATTHYSELKIYALKEKGVMNASCEFDVETLRPTYRILTGIPGKSNAFAISRKLGLSESIIKDASVRLDKKDEDFEDVISELDVTRRQLEEEQIKLEGYRREAENLKNSLEAKQKKLDEQRDRIISEAKEEARDILKDAKSLADETIKYFQKHGNNASMADMENTRRKLREKIDKTSSPSMPIVKNEDRGYKASDFHLGDEIKILSLNMEGKVTSLPDNKGNFFAQCGIIRTQTNIKDVELLELKAAAKGSGKASYTGQKFNKSSSISAEINLLGLTVDEAVSKLDKYLDDAYLSHLSKVRIVHGKGTGALRNAVHNHLKKTSYIKSFSLASYGEGDAGVTIAEFK